MSIYMGTGRVGSLKKAFEYMTGYPIQDVVDYDYVETDEVWERRYAKLRDWKRFNGKSSHQSTNNNQKRISE